jgi:ElaB/YqjD/DUF883 family membrane-anchored ribosome-binding protein
MNSGTPSGARPRGPSVLLWALLAVAPAAAQRITEPAPERRTPAGDVPYTIDDTEKPVDPDGRDVVDRIENELIALDAQLESLARRAGEGSREALREVRQKRFDAQRRLEQFRAAAQGEWRAVKPQLEKSLGELRDAFERLRRSVRPPASPPPADDPTP